MSEVADEDDEKDEASLIGFHMVASTVRGGPPVTTAPPLSNASSTPNMAPEPPEDDSNWEVRFAWGVYHSRTAAESLEDADTICGWMWDQHSQTGVPALMRKAEELMRQALASAPSQRHKEKTAEMALRLYYHAKWLAEHNQARAAEWRYRQAAHLAKQSRRTVLAAHALSRLGYFLKAWGRPDEARAALWESERCTLKSNPLAPFLYGVLERRAAGSDIQRLRAAEERILAAGEQPSEELEHERQQLQKEIVFWRAAEGSPSRCADTDDVANVIICMAGNLAMVAHKAIARL